MNTIKQVITESVKRLAQKWAHQVLLELKLRQGTTVLVYQMGKVGSSSVHQSLLKQYAGVVLNAHSFSVNHENF